MVEGNTVQVEEGSMRWWQVGEAQYKHKVPEGCKRVCGWALRQMQRDWKLARVGETEQFVTFPACGKAAGKVTNHDHMTGDMATIISSRQLPSIRIGIT